MRRVGIILAVGMLLVGVSTALCAEVSQGRCVKFDPTKMLITIEEYDTDFSPDHPYGRPTGTISVYDASTAKIGAHPKEGDILRIAYEVKGTDRVAIKVMNVTRQDLRKK